LFTVLTSGIWSGSLIQSILHSLQSGNVQIDLGLQHPNCVLLLVITTFIPAVKPGGAGDSDLGRASPGEGGPPFLSLSGLLLFLPRYCTEDPDDNLLRHTSCQTLDFCLSLCWAPWLNLLSLTSEFLTFSALTAPTKLVGSISCFNSSS